MSTFLRAAANTTSIAQTLSALFQTTNNQNNPSIVPGPGGALRPPMGADLSGMDWLKIAGLMVTGTVASTAVLCCICMVCKCLRGNPIQRSDKSELTATENSNLLRYAS